MAKLRAAIAGATLRGSRAKLAQGKLVDALDGLVAVLRETQTVAEPAMQHFQRAGAAAKTAATGLRAYCSGGSAAQPPLADPGEWVTAAVPAPLGDTPKPPGGDARDLTVVVSFKPPGSLAADFERASRGASGQYGPLYRAAATGGFGSGFVVVRRSAHDDRSVPFIVTNRHVVDLADHVTVTRSDGTSLRARILYSDPHYDLAVLALETDAKVFDHGFAFETSAGKDQQAVAAVGYPGLGNEPSYQVTKGYVSNDRFELDTGGLKLHYLQHTAPIDRGSSGGPLLSEGGKVLGVNTLKATGRENVAFAVPQAAVIDAVRYASTLEERMVSADFRRQKLRDDCLDLVAELASAHPRTAHAEQLVSTRMIAEQGVESYNLLSKDDENLQKLWQENPLDTLRFALVRRIWKEAGTSGIDPTETCSQPNQSDWDQILTTDRVRIPLHVGGGTREIVMRWEQGRWKIAHMDFQSAVEPPTPPKNRAKGKTTKR
jgi:serine protease Do